MKSRSLFITFLSGIALCAALLHPKDAHAGAPFDFDTGSAPKDLVIPQLIPVIFSTVSPGDAPLVLRTTTLITNSWFDAIAPYGETTVGVYSRIDRRPISERTDANRNIAILYASKKVLDSLYPELSQNWRDILLCVGLDPDDDSNDLSTPIGIGNVAGAAVVAVREQDGMNQLGDEGLLKRRHQKGRGNGHQHHGATQDPPRTYNLWPYADYTGFSPANSAYDLTDPSKWQPAITTTGYGVYKVQQFVTPQYAKVLPYSYDDPSQFRAPAPEASNHRKRALYREQAEEVLAASAAMTDEQKVIAELFDNKINSLGFSALFASTVEGLSLEEFVHYDFLTNMAAFDTGIAIWKEKTRWNAVRPFSAIPYIYGDSEVTAWGGPFQGTVTDLPAKEWTSYLPVADHPEYPSASASFCFAHAKVSRLYFGSDDLNWAFPVPAGSSVIEPGHTPQADIVISFPTWTDFAERCGQSRFWAGVHFPASIPAGQDIADEVADHAWEFFESLLDGTAPAP